MSTITIHLTDAPGGGIDVLTTAGTPIPGQQLTPAQTLAHSLLGNCHSSANNVHYWQGRDKALELVQLITLTDEYAYAVSPEVYRAAVRVLGRQPMTTAAPGDNA